MEKNYKVIFPEKKKVEVAEWAMPEVGDNDLLIKVDVSQISTGTELTMLEANVEPDSPWQQNIVYPNLCVGYSSVGRIVAAGKDVSPDVIGKRVFAQAFHEKYAVYPADAYEGLMWVPENVASEDAVFCAIASITNGSIRCSEIRPGDACVVYGAGIIGQMVARFAKAAGSTRVFVADISDLRLSKLPQDPCFIPINSTRENVAEVVKKNTIGGEGVPVVFETTGAPALIPQELACLCQRGKLIITSSPKGKSLVDLDYCNRMGISIIGAHNFAVHPDVETPFNRWTKRRDSDYFLELLSKNQMTVNEMHTHRFHYKDAVAAYEMLMNDRTQALSVLIDWED